ncbi:Kinesin-like protein KIN-14M (AtKIN14c) (Kinesin-like protein KatB) [Durusdinium trenchii]|uniref:Kinesin-like protein n=1 Tax=Durusdinium trenchii TaxID=1381693 RepID=A0ABP0J9C0_9DINO
MEAENKELSPVVQTRKRKSEAESEPPGSARKVLAEINRSSGLPAPGWAKSSSGRQTRSMSKKAPAQPPAPPAKAGSASPAKNTATAESVGVPVDAPKESVDDLALKAFGPAEEREQKKSELLKRSKPDQKLFGYAKKFLDSETKRLATGLKDAFTTREQFIDACKDHERAMLSALQGASFKAEQMSSTVRESKRKLLEHENELAELRLMETMLKTEVEKLKASLETQFSKEKHAMDSAAKLEEEKRKLEDQVAEAHKELKVKEEATAELAATIAKLEAAQADFDKQLATMREEHHAATEALKTSQAEVVEQVKSERATLEQEIPVMRAKVEALEGDLQGARDEVKDLGAKLSAAEQDKHRLQATADNLREQIGSMESQVKQKDQHLDKTLETFQQNQSFSQERIASLSEEKARLEVRVEDLNKAKGEFEVDNTKLQAQLKEASESNSQLKTSLEERSAEVASLTRRFENLQEESASAVTNLEVTKRENAALTVQVEKITKAAELDKVARATEAQQWATARSEMEETLKQLQEANAGMESEIQALRRTYGETGATADERLEKLCEVSKEAAMLKHKVEDLDRLRERLAATEEELKETQAKLFESDKAKRQLHNEVQALKGKVRVVARVRPSKIESDESGVECRVDGTSLVVSTEHAKTSGKEVRKHEFSFDRVFAERSTQADVFDEVSSFVQSALDGYNVCLFSYGQTGSGKTFTMTGDHMSPALRGIIPRAIDQIMSYQTELRSRGWEYTLEATYVEIYNEAICDLLSKHKNPEKVEIRDSKKEIILSNVQREPIGSKESIHQVLDLAQRNRSVAATDSNEHSSRSHSVFTLFIKGVNREFKAQVSGSLSMCDLAGSERISRSGATGERLKEAQAINKSLSNLSNVFSSLQKKAGHVPYRNSKLTHMLQPCFTGEGKTMMIVNLSPEQADRNESLCSLRFAGQVSSTELGRAKKQIASIDK